MNKIFEPKQIANTIALIQLYECECVSTLKQRAKNEGTLRGTGEGEAGGGGGKGARGRGRCT